MQTSKNTDKLDQHPAANINLTALLFPSFLIFPLDVRNIYILKNLHLTSTVFFFH